jgi:hypothetical protein
MTEKRGVRDEVEAVMDVEVGLSCSCAFCRSLSPAPALFTSAFASTSLNFHHTQIDLLALSTL